MDKEDEFARDICTLAQQPIFDLITFEGTIDKMRSFVAEVSNRILFLRKQKQFLIVMKSIVEKIVIIICNCLDVI